MSIPFSTHRDAGAIPHDQHGNLFLREPPFCRLATPLASLALKAAALSFEGQQKHRFVRFGNTWQRRWLKGHWQLQEAMPPAVCRTDVNVQQVSHLVQRQTITQRLGLTQPLAPLVQATQWRTSQSFERLAAAVQR